MHLNFASLLAITSALATPFALGAAVPARMTNMKDNKIMQMPPNETIQLGRAVVDNHCPMSIYLWSVGQNISSETVLHPGMEYYEVFRRDPKTGGIAIKITTVPDGLYTSAPQTIFAYNLVNDTVWYDLSDVFGDPFEGDSVSLIPSEPVIHWDEGIPPSGSQVRMLNDATTDLVLILCAGRDEEIYA